MKILVVDHQGYEEIFRRLERRNSREVKVDFINREELGKGQEVMQYLPNDADIYFIHADNSEVETLSKFKENNPNTEVFVRVFISPTYDYTKIPGNLDGWYSGERKTNEILENICNRKGILLS